MRVIMRSGFLRRLGWTPGAASASDVADDDDDDNDADDADDDDDVDDSEWETRVAECAPEPVTGTELGAYALWFAQCMLGDRDVRDTPPGNFRARVHHALRQLVVD